MPGRSFQRYYHHDFIRLHFATLQANACRRRMLALVVCTQRLLNNIPSIFVLWSPHSLLAKCVFPRSRTHGRRKHSCAHAHTVTRAHAQAHTHTQTRPHSPARTHTRTHALTYTVGVSHTCKHTHANTHTHTHTHTRTHTTRTRARAHTPTHKQAEHTGTQSPPYLWEETKNPRRPFPVT